MVAVDQQTWMSLVGMAGFALALFSYLGVIRRDLRGEISGTCTELKAEIADTRAELRAETAELRAEIADTRAELKGEIADTRTELRAEIRETRAELKAEITSTRTDLKDDIGKLDGRMTSIEQRTFELRGLFPAAVPGAESR